MRDISDAGNALQNVRPFEIKKISASGYSSTAAQGIENSVTIAGHRVSFKTQTRREIGCRVVGGVRIGGVVPSYPDGFGFDYPNFVPTAWELCPWSFFVDYFTNIQEIIGAATQVNAGLAWASKTLRMTSESWSQLLEVRLLNPTTNYSTTANPGSAMMKDVEIIRESLGTVIPGFTWQIPGVNAAFNVAALALQGGVHRPFF